ncbi:MAG: tail fiber protein [Methylobacteriaceae bacterium]|nr:tail fiber protein [Methylobacteriaceae bacterium]
MTLYKWSQTAASDATADSTINWAEGQAPSSINDSARAMMAATAKYRDDIAGAIVTAGTSTAYTVSSYEAFDTLAHLSGQMIAFTPHTTNGATVTLNVDSLGAKPLRTAPNTELLAGTIIQGTPYVAVYNNTDGAFYLQGFYANPYLIPLGGLLDYIGTSAPNSQLVMPFGQAISRTTYASLFALIGTTFGTGDGSTTFNVPDLRGRVAVGVDNMGGPAANRLTNAGSGIPGTTLGASGGNQSITLVTPNLPPYTPVGTISQATVSQSFANNLAGGGVIPSSGGNFGFTSPIISAQTFSGNAQGGTSTPFSPVPPLICLNKLLRVI